MAIVKNLSFINCNTENQINDIYNFNVQVFADSQNFAWTKENIKSEIEAGWELFSVNIDNDIICVLFLKEEAGSLLTKNTPIKINFQGNGFSHIIKEFYEECAKDKGLNSVYNYCPVDNFRMISLNEGHNYKKTGKSLPGDIEIIEWIKDL